MTDPFRLTAPAAVMIDIDDEMPTPGSRVLAIGLGGCLAPVVWGSESHKHFKAWCHYPQIPASVKAKLLHVPKKETT